MRGKICKFTDFEYSGKKIYRIEYQRGDLHLPHWLDIDEEDMIEFIKDISKDWDKERQHPVKKEGKNECR